MQGQIHHVANGAAASSPPIKGPHNKNNEIDLFSIFFNVTITGYCRVDLTVIEFKQKRISVTLSVYWKKLKMYEKIQQLNLNIADRLQHKTCAAQMGSASCSWLMGPTNCFDLGPPPIEIPWGYDIYLKLY